MAVNLAEKYSSVVAERFATELVTNVGFNNDYDWAGTRTVKVYSIETSPLNDYVRSGTQRYGVPQELNDTVQELTLSQDKAFSVTIDRGNNIDQMNIKGAGIALDRQIHQQIIPVIDTYRLATLAANAGGDDDTAATRENAYELFLNGQEFMGDNQVPVSGRVAFISYRYYNLLKLDPSFTTAGDMAEISLVRGALGYIDGIPLIPVPEGRLPAGTQFILVHPIAACAPIKLAEFTLHDNPPGISGNLIEGRIYFDCFVLDAKKEGVYFSAV